MTEHYGFAMGTILHEQTAFESLDYILVKLMIVPIGLIL
jgi:hypothetical protein